MIEFVTSNVRRNPTAPTLFITTPLYMRWTNRPGIVEMMWGCMRTNPRGIIVYDQTLKVIYPYDALIESNKDVGVAARNFLRRQAVQ